MSVKGKSSVKTCRAFAIKGDSKCFSHSENPDVVAKRTAGRRKGGRHAKRPSATIETVADARTLLARIVRKVENGKLPARVLSAVNKSVALLLKTFEVEKGQTAKNEQSEEKRERILAEIAESGRRYDDAARENRRYQLDPPPAKQRNSPQREQPNVHGKPGEFCGCPECQSRRKTEEAMKKMESSVIAVKVG